MELAAAVPGDVSCAPVRAEPDLWLPAIENALAGEGLTMVHQPVVDLQRGVVAGYECLARFHGPPSAPPNAWFAVAVEYGLGVELEAVALRSALAGRADIPANCFLSVNVTPDYLLSDVVRGVLDDYGDLAGIVLELTEHTGVNDFQELGAVLRDLKAAGASIAIDDAGAGYAGLQWMMALDPDIVKLDRSLVAGIERDEVRRALVTMLGDFAGRINAWLLAEGLETRAELQAVAAMGVPLGQGWVFGKPARGWPTLETSVAHSLARRPPQPVDDVPIVASLVEGLTPGKANSDTADVHVSVDEMGRPTALHTRMGRNDRPMKVKPTEPIADVLARAVTRRMAERWDPLICIDDLGRYRGVVRLERLINASLNQLKRSNS